MEEWILARGERGREIAGYEPFAVHALSEVPL
jgi:hypothetical protein